MTAARARLTEFDIRRLIKASDDDDRAAAAHKLCRSMEQIDMSEEDRAAAQKIPSRFPSSGRHRCFRMPI
jgi:uncharacterized protein (DUF2336 family)